MGDQIFEFKEEKHEKARKAVIIGGLVIIIAITLLSCVSSFMIYKEGFTDLPWFFQYLLAAFAVIVVEGAFIWLVYGFTNVFSSYWERVLSFLGMWGLAAVMLTNIVTHFMLVKHVELANFQQGWLRWGAVTIFIAVLILVLAIRLADPVIRFIRLELRFLGLKHETVLDARREGLGSEVVRQAMSQRAEIEAEQLAAKILGNNNRYLQPHMIKGFSDGGQTSSYSYSPPQRKIKASDEDDDESEPKRYDSH